jgi:hypothetical protein
MPGAKFFWRPYLCKNRDLPSAVQSINTACNLFMQGQVKSAITEARNDMWRYTFVYYLEKVKAGISSYLDTHRITVGSSIGLKITFAPVDNSGTAKKDASKKQSGNYYY